MIKADEQLSKGRAFTENGVKQEYNLLSDKAEGKKYVDKFNRNAERAGLDERYVWLDDENKKDKNLVSYIIPNQLSDYGEASDESGWVKVNKDDVSEFDKQKKEGKQKDTPRAEIEAMESGELFWFNGKQYGRK